MKRNIDSTYLCKGENYTEKFSMGSCGKIKTLREWMICLFGEKAIEYFKGYPEKEIVDYIYKNAGKRLEKNRPLN